MIGGLVQKQHIWLWRQYPSQSAAASVPATAREDKKVRAVMRVLGLRYESVKRAIEIRKAMVDTAVGWRWIQTKPHCDRTDWTPLKKWFSDLDEHYGGIVDGCTSGKAGGHYYHVAFDDGDGQDHTWREIQLGTSRFHVSRSNSPRSYSL